MSGRRQKHPDALQNKRGGRYHPLKLIPPEGRTIPRCPSGIGAQARAYWKLMWGSRLAGAWGDIDAIPLGRYIRYVSEWLVTTAQIEKEGPVITGTRGDPVLHPEVRYVFRLEQVMRDLEKSYGLDPMARLRLGVSLAAPYDPAAALKRANAIAEYKQMEEK